MLAAEKEPYLRRSAVTVLAGGASFALTNLWATSIFQQLALSIFVGGFILLVQLLVDVEARLGEVEDGHKALADALKDRHKALADALRDGHKALADAVKDRHEELTAAVERRTTDFTAMIVEGLDGVGEAGRKSADRLESSVGERLARLDATIAREIGNFGAAVELVNQAIAAGLPPAAVMELVRRTVGLGSDVPVLITEFLRGEVARLTDLVHGIGHGEVAWDGEDIDGLLGFTRRTQHSIDAISTESVDNTVFWRSELGMRYLRLQREAIDRGVKVRRVFVSSRLSLDGGVDQDLREVLGRHLAAGIRVKVLPPAEVPSHLAPDLVDFILFDGTLSYETTAAAYVTDVGARIQSTRFFYDPGRVPGHVVRRRDCFEGVWAAARDWPPAV